MDHGSPSGGQASWSELLAAHRLATFVLLCLGVWLNAVDALVASTIMPSVARDIGGYAYFAWATAGYMLGSIRAGAGAGLLAERVGLRRGLALCGVLYAAGCVMSALAPGVWPFLAGRLVQGAGAGFIVGLCYVGVRAQFPERLWSFMFASLSAVWGVATLLGPLMGGLFAEAHFWRGVFWAFGLQAVAFAVVAMIALPTSDRLPEARRSLPVAQLGLLTLAVALVAAAGVLGRPLAAALTAFAGLALLWITLKLDGRSRVRLLPRAAGDLSSAPGLGYAAVLCLSAGAIGFSVYGAALLQTRLGLGPLAAGYVVASESIGWTVTALWVARTPPAVQAAMIRVGGSLVALGLAGCALTGSSAGVWPIALSGLAMGGGFGLCWSFVSQRILGGVPEMEGALGSAAIPTLQILGNAVGSAMAGVVANLLGFAHGFDRHTADHAAPWLFGLFVPVAALGGLAAWRLAGLPERDDRRDGMGGGVQASDDVCSVG